MNSYSFNKNNIVYQTFVTQEMLKKGYLASDKFYSSIAHENDIELYLDALNDVFYDMSKKIENGIDITSQLNGPLRHSGFERLN